MPKARTVQSDSVENIFEDMKQLPALPTTAARIIASLTDEFSTLEDIAEILEVDAGIAARLLGLANSAFYGQTRPVNSVRDAIIRVLGLDLTRGIALGIALGDSFDTKACPEFNVRQFWGISVRCATINTLLTTALKTIPDPDRKLAYSAGLMAELGILALVTTKPQHMSQAFSDTSGQSLAQILRDEFGFDQYEAGRVLANRWDLPPRLIECITQPEPILLDVDTPDLVVTTALSLQIARHLELGLPEAEPLLRFSASLELDEIVEEILEGKSSDLENIDEFVSTLTGVRN